LIGNFVGFAPLGFFLPVLFIRQRGFATFIITVVLALICLELVQLLTMRGSFDIDDIILNAVGACLGFWMLRKPVKRIVESRNSE
jgi:glycopeptide antibiotics resistance protein